MCNMLETARIDLRKITMPHVNFTSIYTARIMGLSISQPVPYDRTISGQWYPRPSENSISSSFFGQCATRNDPPVILADEKIGNKRGEGRERPLVNVLITHQFYDCEGERDGTQILGRHASVIVAGARRTDARIRESRSPFGRISSRIPWRLPDVRLLRWNAVRRTIHIVCESVIYSNSIISCVQKCDDIRFPANYLVTPSEWHITQV